MGKDILSGLEDVDFSTILRCFRCKVPVVDDGWYSFARSEIDDEIVYVKFCDKCSNQSYGRGKETK